MPTDGVALCALQVIGAWMLDNTFYGLTDAEAMSKQRLMQTLYESRLASLQRLVSFFVLFHAMGKLVQDFWPRVSCGLLGYDMACTHGSNSARIPMAFSAQCPLIMWHCVHCRHAPSPSCASRPPRHPSPAARCAVVS
jgi:hypothetical protein